MVAMVVGLFGLKVMVTGGDGWGRPLGLCNVLCLKGWEVISVTRTKDDDDVTMIGTCRINWDSKGHTFVNKTPLNASISFFGSENFPKL